MSPPPVLIEGSIRGAFHRKKNPRRIGGFVLVTEIAMTAAGEDGETGSAFGGFCSLFVIMPDYSTRTHRPTAMGQAKWPIDIRYLDIQRLAQRVCNIIGRGAVEVTVFDLGHGRLRYTRTPSQSILGPSTQLASLLERD